MNGESRVVYVLFEDAPTTLFDQLQQDELDRVVGETAWHGFHEQIELTKTGKLWRFPVDNEYGSLYSCSALSVHSFEHCLVVYRLLNHNEIMRPLCELEGWNATRLDFEINDCSNLKSSPYMKRNFPFH